MLEYALGFYQSYYIIFYILLAFIVVIEGPITILVLSSLAPKLGIDFWTILFFAFLGDFLGDILLYSIGKIFHTRFLSQKHKTLLGKLEKKLEKNNLIDTLIFIKYTPPITSIGLIYLGLSHLRFGNFLKVDTLFCMVSSLFISIIGYQFGYLFKDTQSMLGIITGVFLSISFFYIALRFLSWYIFSKKHYEN